MGAGIFVRDGGRYGGLMKQMRNASLESVHIDSAIYLVRGERIILDSDLAKIYGIPTFRLNEAVKRNRNRFPHDALTSQIAMSNKGLSGV